MTPDEIAVICQNTDTYSHYSVQDSTYIVTLYYTDVCLYRNKEKVRYISHDSRSQARVTYNAIRDTLYLVI